MPLASTNSKVGTSDQPLSKQLTRIFNGKPIRQRASDGYINMTDMSRVSGKIVKVYNKSQRAKMMLVALRKHLGPTSTGIKVSQS